MCGGRVLVLPVDSVGSLLAVHAVRSVCWGVRGQRRPVRVLILVCFFFYLGTTGMWLIKLFVAVAISFFDRAKGSDKSLVDVQPWVRSSRSIYRHWWRMR